MTTPICLRCKKEIQSNDIDSTSKDYHFMICPECGHENRVEYSPNEEGRPSYYFVE